MAVTRYLSFVEEPTFGTAVTTGGETIDPESAELDPSGDALLIYEGASRIDKVVAAGNYMSEGSIATAFDLKAFPWFLKWALGGYEVSGTTPAFTHRFFPQQSTLMPSFTARVGKDVFEHVFSGCVVGGITLEMDDSFVTASVDILGGKDSKGTLANPPVFTEGKVFAPCDTTLSINGTDQSAYLEAFTLTIETGADNEAGITAGSRFPRRAYRGGFLVEMEATMSFFDTSQYENFWGDPAGVVNCNVDEYNMTLNMGTEVDILIPRGVYTAVSAPLAGRDRIEQTVTIRGLSAADGSTEPVEFSITNDKATYTVA